MDRDGKLLAFDETSVDACKLLLELCAGEIQCYRSLVSRFADPPNPFGSGNIEAVASRVADGLETDELLNLTSISPTHYRHGASGCQCLQSAAHAGREHGEFRTIDDRRQRAVVVEEDSRPMVIEPSFDGVIPEQGIGLTFVHRQGTTRSPLPRFAVKCAIGCLDGSAHFVRMPESLWRYPRRLARLVRYTVRPPDVVFVHHPDYANFTAAGLTDPARADKILAFLTDAGLIRHRHVSQPLAGSLDNILLIHTPEYVESLSDRAVVGEILGLDLSARNAQEALDVARLMVGGTIQATRLARKSGKIAVHLGGGLHHATPDEGMGFCIFNDVAVAIARLRRKGFDEPILVIDLDLHDGNGTRAAFAADPSVYTFSIHNVAWDDAEAVSSRSIVLGSGVIDDVFMEALTSELPPIIASHRPGLVIYVAGVDSAMSDAIGDWQLTVDGMLDRDRFVVNTVRPNEDGPPLAVVLAGGYGASAWRYSARFLGWLVSGEVIEPPDEMEIVLRQFRERSKTWISGGDGSAVESEWGLKEEDLFGFGVHEDPRFLGQYSKHAVELQLEQLGVLNHMRARGYPNLVVVLDVPSGLGQVVRIYGAPDGADPLMELKATRSRALVPDAEVIEINWLLLQNPKASFAPRRPQLPGQVHPGLGMLRDVAAWLVVVCEEMRLDGVGFVPSQYYMAAVGHRHLQFVEPAARARYEALRKALRGLDLATGTRVLNGGGVIDVRTGQPVFWEPVPMVVPVSQALRERTMSEEYRDAVEATRGKFEFRIRSQRRPSR